MNVGSEMFHVCASVASSRLSSCAEEVAAIVMVARKRERSFIVRQRSKVAGGLIL